MRTKDKGITARTTTAIWGNLDVLAESWGLQGPNGLMAHIMEDIGRSPDGMTFKDKRLWEVVNVIAGKAASIEERMARVEWMVARISLMVETLCQFSMPEDVFEQLSRDADRPDLAEKLLALREEEEEAHVATAP